VNYRYDSSSRRRIEPTTALAKHNDDESNRLPPHRQDKAAMEIQKVAAAVGALPDTSHVLTNKHTPLCDIRYPNRTRQTLEGLLIAGNEFT
jgi:hypothetical protein